MDTENPSENLPEEPPEGLMDRYKCKLRRLSQAVLKPLKSPFSRLKTALKSVLKIVLNTIKGGIRRLVYAKNSLSKWFDANRDKLRKAKIWLVSVIVILFVAAIINYIINEQQVAGQRIFQLERQLEVAIEEKTVLESRLAQMPRLRENLTKLFEEKQLRTAIEKKRIVENKLKDTIARLEKTIGQLRGMEQSEERLANNLEEITRLRENLGKLEQERASVESLARLANTWLEPEAQMQETKATIEMKRLVEKKLKDTASQLEKTARQLKGMDQLREQFVNSLEEITRLKKDLVEQLEAQRSINELLGWWKPEGERPETKKAEKSAPAKAAEEAKKVTHALDEEKPKRPLIYREIQSKPGFFEKSTLTIVFVIVLVGVTFLYLFGLRFQLLRKLIKRAISLVVKERVVEDQLSEFKRLEDISFTLLGGFLLEGFVKMGYEITSSSGITSGRLTCVLERENEKALFRYIICKEDNFGKRFVKDFAKSIKEEKADKGYLVTTGAVAEPLLALAKEKSIELAGKEKLVELIPSCLLEEGLMKQIEDTTAKLIKQGIIAKDEMAEKEALSEKLKGSEDMITKLNDEKTALSEEVKTKEEEYNNLLKKHKYIEKELQKQNEEMSSLAPERDSLQKEISQLQEKAQSFDEQLAKHKNLEEQLSDKDKLLEDERNQRQELEDKLRQSDKDMEEAMYLTDDLEEKLAKKEQELSEKEKALKELSVEGDDFEGAVNKEEFEELRANLKTLQQSLIVKEKTITTFKEFQADLKKELSSKVGLITELQQQLFLAGEKERGIYSNVIAKLEEQLAEKERALSETGKKEAALATKLKARNELLDKLREENQQLSAKKEAYTKRVIIKLQNEVRTYVAEMEKTVFPSLDLTPLAGKGVLLKLEPEGPVVTLKNIGTSGVSFESQRKLVIPSSCNITLIFFGSSNPLTIRGGLIWQKKLPGSSMYNIRFKFLSVKPSQSRRINEYINKTRKTLSKVKK